MLKKSFAGHGPAPQKSQVIDLPLWGGAMRCQKSVSVTFSASDESVRYELVRMLTGTAEIVTTFEIREEP